MDRIHECDEDDYPEYKLVQVRFPSSRLYTYLYPAHWNLKVGDEVKHPGMWGGNDWATVVNKDFEVNRNEIPTHLSLYVLTHHRQPKTHVVKVPHGTKVEVEYF